MPLLPIQMADPTGTITVGWCRLLRVAIQLGNPSNNLHLLCRTATIPGIAMEHIILKTEEIITIIIT